MSSPPPFSLHFFMCFLKPGTWRQPWASFDPVFVFSASWPPGLLDSPRPCVVSPTLAGPLQVGAGCSAAAGFSALFSHSLASPQLADASSNDQISSHLNLFPKCSEDRTFCLSSVAEAFAQCMSPRLFLPHPEGSLVLIALTLCMPCSSCVPG